MEPSVPTFSAPTLSPALAPFVKPTSRPRTLPPLAFPTNPPVPTFPPSLSPTPRPSNPPTPGPTDPPTPPPTVFPTVRPSESTDEPSPSPSSSPTSEPTRQPSPNPSEAPSFSGKPSDIPTNVPSASPSFYPSETPSLSFAPSVILFDSVPIDEDGEPATGANSTAVGLESKCFDSLLDVSGSINDAAVTVEFDFRYTMLLQPGSDATAVAADIEPVLHKRLGIEFLDCISQRRRLQPARGFLPLQISSLPVDEASVELGCDSSEKLAGADCHVVNAGFTVETISTTTDSAVSMAFADWLDDEISSGRMNDANSAIQKLSFRGISEDSVSTGTQTDTKDDERDVAGATGSTGSDNSASPKFIGGTLAIVVAVLAAVIIGLLMMRRRKRKSYLQHLEQDKSRGIEIDDDGLPQPATLANENEEDSDLGQEVELYRQAEDEWKHDVLTCQSPNCHLCLDHKLKMPTFIPVERMTTDIDRDLAPQRTFSSDPRDYEIPDTVAL